MRELGLKCVKFMRKSRKYNSYKGKVGKVVKNRLSRRFYTPIPLQKLVTDITEFKCHNEEKLYLNPILDLYNGEIIAYEIKKRPTLDLVMEPLQEAIEIIKNRATYRTTLHTDQGWHYQHNQWVRTLKENKVFQSMSRKATCADNASMENFFGILKQEMYHGEELVSYEALKKTD
ncbi:IS3 family transposase [Virgibacillus halophilus]|uniref:IS3 family transposase n=1 Tax=Tigheibacillus halophilus TaxID=361280 RepID=A0ABU5C811_9BACI|nr:IS3 family transposase [Virgibacillus halophilus]MDY0394387.1 IS3 family transposase [Virgibacillus halophilus]MDY0395453.1 IS3 family transposase [Virgibacillus halophilus]MDY0395594.1 IS3 family transposase [Virgibacillus halophilus]